MAANYRLCYSADVYFGSPPAPPPPGGQPRTRSITYDPGAGFQLTIESEVSLSTRKRKGSIDDTAGQDALEAQIHLAFVLMDTAPAIEDDDATEAIQVGSIAHCHSEGGEYSDFMVGLDVDSDELR
ncbi:hypothetical protein PG994_001015 [Apiospora phragmitis]|uniref:Uncharacterized protein n=1 Tax=Apiospora phragmitis TaxID=2905665 RepID=A0ABR1WR99_9PEZI